MSHGASGRSSFNEGLASLLARVECRRAVTNEQKDEIYRLRYRSYLREGAVPAQTDERFIDAFDDMPNSWSFGVYVDGKVASSLRLTFTTPTCKTIPAETVFPDVIRPLLAEGKTVLDPTRFVVEDQHAKLYPKLPYVTLRLAFLASEFYEADVTLATVRTEHQAFYRRLLGYRLVCPARPYPSLLKPISLMSLNHAEQRARGFARYPFLASTVEERNALFAPVTQQRSGSGKTGLSSAA